MPVASIPSLGGLGVGLFRYWVNFHWVAGTAKSLSPDSSATAQDDDNFFQCQAISFQALDCHCHIGNGNSLGPEGPSVDFGDFTGLRVSGSAVAWEWKPSAKARRKPLLLT